MHSVFSVSKAAPACFLGLHGSNSQVACDGGGGGQQASCLVAKQAVEFPQVLVSDVTLRSYYQAC